MRAYLCARISVSELHLETSQMHSNMKQSSMIPMIEACSGHKLVDNMHKVDDQEPMLYCTTKQRPSHIADHAGLQEGVKMGLRFQKAWEPKDDSS